MTRITDNLHIRDIQGVREQDTSQFDMVVTVCQDEVGDNVGCRYEWFNMADGPHCGYGGDSSYELFEEAAETVLWGLLREDTVLCHCHMGQSRSVAVSIAALAVADGMAYNEAYNLVDGKRNIHPDELLVDHAKRFIDDRAGGFVFPPPDELKRIPADEWPPDELTEKLAEATGRDPETIVCVAEEMEIEPPEDAEWEYFDDEESAGTGPE